MQQISRFFIKGMVCQRCIDVIKKELTEIGLEPIKISLGEVTVLISDTEPNYQQIEKILTPLGFQLLEDRKLKIVKEIKKLVEQVYSGDYDFPVHFRFSDLVVAQVHKDYDNISAWFSAVEQKTIERYIIDYRIQKVKELLVYTSLTLADIAFKLNFSSVAHLSRQFKQYSGLTPSHFKQIKTQKIEIEFSNN